jgi:hypothetical protein
MYIFGFKMCTAYGYFGKKIGGSGFSLGKFHGYIDNPPQ